MEERQATLAATTGVVWWQSLRTRLVLLAGLGSLLLIAGIAVAFYVTVRETLIANTRVEMRGLAEQTALGLEATLETVQVGTRELALVARHPDLDADDMRALLDAAVLSDPDTVGAMLIVEPGRLNPDDPGFSWYVRRDGDRLVGSTVEALGYDVKSMPWYRRTAIDGQAWWSEPYANAATGDQMFVTYNLPVRMADGGLAGMASLDVPLARLVARVGSVPDAAGLRPMLLSPQRLIVTHPADDIRMHSSLDAYIDAGRSDLAPLLQAVRARERIELAHVVATSVAGSEQGERRYSFALPVGDTGWTFALTVSQQFLLQRFNRVTRLILGGALLAVVFGLLVVRRMTVVVVAPIEDLTESARHFGLGEFDRAIHHVDRRDEVGVMARVFDTTRHSIKRQLIEIAEFGAAKERLEGELRIAADIQQAMLPRGEDFAIGGSHLTLAGVLDPAKAVGGDFYNFFSRDGESLWFVIGDVSDKGIPAALFMARTMTVLEVAAHDGNDPGAALREAARHLVQANDTCMFATVLCGAVKLRTGEFVLASAAHEPPVLLRADGTRDFVEVPTTPPLGIDVADDYPALRGRLEPGDTLLGYTDGITEAFDAGDAAFGSERLLAALDAAREPGAQCAALVAAVHAFADGAPQSDDITVLALRYGRGG
jgi:sigma-B regulation protein RsbU (phosphoserine phosphatase)